MLDFHLIPPTNPTLHFAMTLVSSSTYSEHKFKMHPECIVFISKLLFLIITDIFFTYLPPISASADINSYLKVTFFQTYTPCPQDQLAEHAQRADLGRQQFNI